MTMQGMTHEESEPLPIQGIDMTQDGEDTLDGLADADHVLVPRDTARFVELEATVELDVERGEVVDNVARSELTQDVRQRPAPVLARAVVRRDRERRRELLRERGRR